MRIVEPGEFQGWCEGRGERRRLNMMLIGEQPAGTWVLAFLDTAREVLSEESAGEINSALDALEAAMRGEFDPARDLLDFPSAAAGNNSHGRTEQ